MRKIVVYIAVSTDGFIARGDGSVDWLERSGAPADYGMTGFYSSIDTILWGRETYELARRRGDRFDRRVRHYVFSRRSLGPLSPGVEQASGTVQEFAGRLRSEPGKDVWMMGGAGLLGSFLDAGEIDELILHVIPALIGEGVPLAAPRRRTTPLTLLSSLAFDDGVVRLHYRVERER
jgi:dihydrofolate reductase